MTHTRVFLLSGRSRGPTKIEAPALRSVENDHAVSVSGVGEDGSSTVTKIALAPGATFTIERVPNNDGEYVIRYATTGTHELRTLQIDERRNRYVFRPQTLQVQTDDSWLLTQTRFPRLANVKPLDDRERRRTDAVVGAAFERAAENVGSKGEPRYWSSPEELLPVVNIERPFSLRALREVLESPQYSQFSADPETPGAFYYEPPAKKAAPAAKRRAARAEEDEDEFEDEE